MIGDFLSCLKVKNFLSASILHGSVTSHFLLRLDFSSWSNWSSCDGECGRHGMRNRSKDCYADGMIWNTTLNCTHFSDEKYEEDEQCYMDHYPCYSKYFILLIYKSIEQPFCRRSGVFQTQISCVELYLPKNPPKPTSS